MRLSSNRRLMYRNGQTEVLQNYIAFLHCGKGLNLKEVAFHLGHNRKTVEYHWANYGKRAGTTDPLQVLKQMIVKGEVVISLSQADRPMSRAL